MSIKWLTGGTPKHKWAFWTRDPFFFFPNHVLHIFQIKVRNKKIYITHLNKFRLSEEKCLFLKKIWFDFHYTSDTNIDNIICCLPAPSPHLQININFLAVLSHNCTISSFKWLYWHDIKIKEWRSLFEINRVADTNRFECFCFFSLQFHTTDCDVIIRNQHPRWRLLFNTVFRSE